MKEIIINNKKIVFNEGKILENIKEVFSREDSTKKSLIEQCNTSLISVLNERSNKKENEKQVEIISVDNSTIKIDLGRETLASGFAAWINSKKFEPKVQAKSNNYVVTLTGDSAKNFIDIFNTLNTSTFLSKVGYEICTSPKSPNSPKGGNKNQITNPVIEKKVVKKNTKSNNKEEFFELKETDFEKIKNDNPSLLEENKKKKKVKICEIKSENLSRPELLKDKILFNIINNMMKDKISVYQHKNKENNSLIGDVIVWNKNEKILEKSIKNLKIEKDIHNGKTDNVTYFFYSLTSAEEEKIILSHLSGAKSFEASNKSDKLIKILEKSYGKNTVAVQTHQLNESTYCFIVSIKELKNNKSDADAMILYLTAKEAQEIIDSDNNKKEKLIKKNGEKLANSFFLVKNNLVENGETKKLQEVISKNKLNDTNVRKYTTENSNSIIILTKEEKTLENIIKKFSLGKKKIYLDNNKKNDHRYFIALNNEDIVKIYPLKNIINASNVSINDNNKDNNTISPPLSPKELKEIKIEKKEASYDGPLKNLLTEFYQTKNINVNIDVGLAADLKLQYNSTEAYLVISSDDQKNLNNILSDFFPEQEKNEKKEKKIGINLALPAVKNYYLDLTNEEVEKIQKEISTEKNEESVENSQNSKDLIEKERVVNEKKNNNNTQTQTNNNPNSVTNNNFSTNSNPNNRPIPPNSSINSNSRFSGYGFFAVVVDTTLVVLNSLLGVMNKDANAQTDQEKDKLDIISTKI